VIGAYWADVVGVTFAQAKTVGDQIVTRAQGKSQDYRVREYAS